MSLKSNPKLFIASSGRAKTLADQLSLSLINNDIDAIVWYVDNDSFHAGRSILEGLLAAAKEYDFAAVILTKDDLLNRSNDPNGNILNAPRDNCIFELGFFIGALNLEPQRCFFLASISDEALPSDLKNYLYYKIVEPTNWDDRDNCKDKILKASLNIADRVKRIGPLMRLPKETVISFDDETKMIEFKPEKIRIHLLTSAKLMELEDIGNSMQSGSEVRVQKIEPSEVDLSWAKRVQANMSKGIKYHYFFSIEGSGGDKIAARIANMLLMLAVANVIGQNQQMDFDIWKRSSIKCQKIFVSENKEEIRRNLTDVKEQLFIHFTAHRLAEEYRIHNADSEDSRKCYLRWLGTDYYIELTREQAKMKSEACESFMHHSNHTIFGSTENIPLYKVEKDLCLRSVLRDSFPEDFLDDSSQIFFGQ